MLTIWPLLYCAPTTDFVHSSLQLFILVKLLFIVLFLTASCLSQTPLLIKVGNGCRLIVGVTNCTLLIIILSLDFMEAMQAVYNMLAFSQLVLLVGFIASWVCFVKEDEKAMPVFNTGLLVLALMPPFIYCQSLGYIGSDFGLLMGLVILYWAAWPIRYILNKPITRVTLGLGARLAWLDPYIKIYGCADEALIKNTCGLLICFFYFTFTLWVLGHGLPPYLLARP